MPIDKKHNRILKTDTKINTLQDNKCTDNFACKKCLAFNFCVIFKIQKLKQEIVFLYKLASIYLNDSTNLLPGKISTIYNLVILYHDMILLQGTVRVSGSSKMLIPLHRASLC